MDSAYLGDALGFASLRVFAMPAISIAATVDRTWRFVMAEHSDTVDPRLHRLKQELDQTLLARLRRWSPWHSRLLYLGYALAVASYGVKLLS